MNMPGYGDIAFSPDLPASERLTESAPSAVIATGTEGPLNNIIQFLEGGLIQIGYAWSDAPPTSIYLWHEGGATEPINTGWNNFMIGAGDCIIWTLSSPTNMIKITWNYGDSSLNPSPR